MKDLTYIAIIALTGFIAFQSGQLWKYHQLKPTIIEHQGAHYDPQSGDFVWGKFSDQYNNAGMDILCKDPKSAKTYACIQWNSGKQQ